MISIKAVDLGLLLLCVNYIVLFAKLYFQAVTLDGDITIDV